MERRTFTFIALSLAILLGAQALQAWFFPQPKRDLRQQAENTAAPAAASAATSACGPPNRSCQPAPMIAPSRATTAPTIGFGSTCP